MTTMTVTTTRLRPPLLRAHHYTTTHEVPGTPEEAAQRFLSNSFIPYMQESPTHLRRWRRLTKDTPSATDTWDLRPTGEWEVIDVRFTGTPAEPTLF